MLPGILKVQELQKELYESCKREWSEKDYHEKWFLEPYGNDYDYWYKRRLYPVDFCSMCGEDLEGLKHSWDFIRNNHSRYGVRIYLCKECYEKCGFTSEDKSAPEDYSEIYMSLFKGLLLFIFKIILFYLILPDFNYRLYTAIILTTMLWFVAWFMSKLNHPHVNSNLLYLRFHLPLFLGSHAVLLKYMYYIVNISIIIWLIALFSSSIKVGLIASTASIILFWSFIMRQQKNMKQSGALGG